MGLQPSCQPGLQSSQDMTGAERSASKISRVAVGGGYSVPPGWLDRETQLFTRWVSPQGCAQHGRLLPPVEVSWDTERDRQTDREDLRWKLQSFYHLISEMIRHHFCPFLCIRRESLGLAHTQAKEITQWHGPRSCGDGGRGQVELRGRLPQAPSMLLWFLLPLPLLCASLLNRLETRWL